MPVIFFSSCDDVQLESVTSWFPHDEHSMSFRVDAKEKEQIEEMSLKEQPPSPKMGSKKKEKAFKIGEQVYLDYPLDLSLSDELRECELFLFKVVKNGPDGLVEVYNMAKGCMRIDPKHLKHKDSCFPFSMRRLGFG